MLFGWLVRFEQWVTFYSCGLNSVGGAVKQQSMKTDRSRSVGLLYDKIEFLLQDGKKTLSGGVDDKWKF